MALQAQTGQTMVVCLRATLLSCHLGQQRYTMQVKNSHFRVCFCYLRRLLRCLIYLEEALEFFVWMLDINSYRPCFEKIRNRLQICHELRLLGLGQTHKCNVENLFSPCSYYLASDCNPSSMFQGNTRHIFSNQFHNTINWPIQ